MVYYFAMPIELHVVLEIASGKKPFTETLERLRALGWKESSRRYRAYPNVVNEAGQDAGKYHYWDALGEDAWVSEQAFPNTQNWSEREE
jgi:hypothetical protein